jgi:hypothetical protein
MRTPDPAGDPEPDGRRGLTALRLQVGIRVAGHSKSSFTYLQLLEDLVDVSAGPSSLLEAGFLDYRMVRVAIDLPQPDLDLCDRKLHCELAADKLWSTMKPGLGADPRQLSGRLAVIALLSVKAGPDPATDTAAQLRRRGYRVELLDQGGFP